MPSSLDFTSANFRASLQSSLAEINALGPIPGRIDDYLAKRGDVDPDLATSDIPGLKARMAKYLKGRGANLDSDSRFGVGGYDEILFTAYDRSLNAQRGGDDPIIAVKRGEEIGSWDFSVEKFETTLDQGIDPNAIRAAGAIDYIYELGERMGVFRLAEALVLNWAAGRVDVVDNVATTKLYAYWKQLDDRSDADERGMLYRRVLGKGDSQMLSRMVANDGFQPLWSNLMGEIATYIDKSERLEAGLSETSSVSTGPIMQSIRELQYNLTEYCTGMAFVQAHESYKQLQSAFDVLRDPDIVANFGGPRRRNMWTVIAELSKEDFGQSIPIGPLLRVAVDGNRLFQIVADFDGSLSSDDMRNLIEAGESYIINSSVIGDQMGDGSTKMAEDDGYEEDDDGFSDDAFEDDFADV
jgi:hypothetical protein